MKYLFSMMVLYCIAGFASDEMTLDGTLFKKNDSWFLFVEMESVSLKKGTIALTNISKQQNKYLVEKSYVRVIGQRGKCEFSYICMNVETIRPAMYDPLKGRKK